MIIGVLVCVLFMSVIACVGIMTYKIGHSDGKQEGLSISEGRDRWIKD